MIKIITLAKIAAVLLFVLLFDAIIYEPYTLKITNYNISNSKLAGIKIVFAADFHIAPYKWEKWRLQRIIETINAQNPDLVILGGDYVNRHDKKSTMNPNNIALFLQQIKAPKVAVLGNHDSYYGKIDVKKSLENASIIVLDNQNIKLNLHNQDIYISGVSDYDTDNPDMQKALKNAGKPLIFVSHSPDAFANLNGAADIAFAGHTHGGQIILPFFGALVHNIQNAKKYTYGLIYEHDKPLIISSGLGTSVIPVRFNNYPEIVVVNFK